MLLIVLAYLLQVYAIPVSTGPQTLPTLAHTIIWGIEPRSDGSGLGDRTTLTIVRSCLLTIAACVYRAIHQNIPDPKATWWQRQRIQMKITLYAVLAPEAIIYWAMRQWFGAREMAQQMNDLKLGLDWTATHGHFAQMGGFGRLDDGRILHPPTLIKLLNNKQIDTEELKRVTKKRIEDKSKGDILSKGVVALQTTWFVFECLARLQQGLPLIELEVVTFAFAVLNTLTYLFWWDKPLNVLCPIYLHILPPGSGVLVSSAPPTTQSEPSSQERAAAKADEVPVGRRVAIKYGLLAAALSLWRLLTWSVHLIWATMIAIGRGIRDGVKDAKTGIEKDGLSLFVFEWLMVQPFMAVWQPLDDLFSDKTVDDEATHVSAFYGMRSLQGGPVDLLFDVAISDWAQLFVLCSSCLIGTIFGAIHFLAWQSSFLTRTQLLLWRTSTIILVAQPFGMAIEVFFAVRLDAQNQRNIMLAFVGALPLGVGLVSYIFARFCLITLAFLTLRDLPPDTFQTISWTTYIPHL